MNGCALTQGCAPGRLECMLRYAHARRHGTGSVCATCDRARLLMEEPAAQSSPQKISHFDVEKLRDVVRESMPMTEACALGIEYLAGRVGVAAEPVSEALAALGMTIFKNELAFRGIAQRCVSVNKRMRTWAA